MHDTLHQLFCERCKMLWIDPDVNADCPECGESEDVAEEDVWDFEDYSDDPNDINYLELIRFGIAEIHVLQAVYQPLRGHTITLCPDYLDYFDLQIDVVNAAGDRVSVDARKAALDTPDLVLNPSFLEV